jgi:hypothetical protein
MPLMTGALEPYDEAAMAAAISFCEAITHTISIARVMVDSGQTVDLTGLESGIGLLCAKSLDLPPALGRVFRPRLITVLAALDEMTLALNQQNAT